MEFFSATQDSQAPYISDIAAKSVRVRERGMIPHSHARPLVLSLA